MNRLRASVLVGALVTAAIAGGCGDDDPVSSDETTTTVASPDDASSTTTSSTPSSGLSSTTPASDLTGAAAEFAAALEQAGERSYHARYEAQSEAADGTELTSVVEVWRRPPLARRDLTLPTGTSVLRVREYRTADGAIGCFELTASPGEYQCQDVEEGQGIDPAAPAFGAVDPAGGPVEVVEDVVDGVEVRCFQVAAERPEEVCFDGDGIPFVVDDGALRLVRTALDDAITDADLAPPA